MKKTARLLNYAEEYKELGLIPHIVEKWEDGKRSPDRKGDFEWWYFDSIMDDGTSVVVHFNTKQPDTMLKDGSYPVVIIKITTPEGTIYHDSIPYTAAKSRFSTKQCDVKVGPHSLRGDLTDYYIHVEPVHGVGADLRLHNQCKSWRPDTGYLRWGDKNDLLTWLFVVPRGEINGSIIYDGQTRQVHGGGYHDHQWGHGASTFFNVNHWLWGRQNYDDFTVLIFDMVASKKWRNQRFPIFCVQDKEGNVIFESTQINQYFHCEVLEEYYEKDIGRNFPKKIRYRMGNSRIKITYTLNNTLVIDRKDRAKEAGKVAQNAMKLINVGPAYVRYKADGVLEMEMDGKKIIREGNMIYEFAYFALSYKKEMTR